jgi:hypothetical protein
MKGDFSAWNTEKGRNFRGTLHQQGRVLLDRDWNAQTEIFNDWQETAAQDIIGAGVAAVPADLADSFKVTRAEVSGSEVKVWINKGRVWADGLPVSLYQDSVFKATYFDPPVQNPAGKVTDLPKNVRDAVILETWLEELNAFQMPELLIEPALGGVDTTERIRTPFRFRLFRMDEDDTCDSIIDRLKNNPDAKGKLKAFLQPDTTTDGDCPVVEGGGYTGFEHQLYRVEIAQTKHNKAHFKWSQFNGGLVGRGNFIGGDAPKIEIKANLNAILHSGITDFYLETLQETDGCWEVTYGAKATLDKGNNSLTLPLPADTGGVYFGSMPTPETEKFFFRLWNDVRPITDFNSGEELQDGIHLQFEGEAAGKYTPHDFWTFEVRAGEIKNNKTLIDNKPPQGILYHRVPLAELEWESEILGVSSKEQIEDCRRIFQPLTRLKTCCTYRVGDGVTSHGDFSSIQTAIEHLPKEGGEICVLPGNFPGNIKLEGSRRRNIIIKGCGNRTHLIAENSDPVIHIMGGMQLRLENFAVLAHPEGVGILLEGDEIVADDKDHHKEFGVLRNIKLERLQITAVKRSAIEMHVGQFVSIQNCRILMRDVKTEWAAVYLAGDDLLFEDNEIRVLTAGDKTSQRGKIDDPQGFSPARMATGGLHLAGGCERVRVIGNVIVGGTGNGINLGGVDEETEEKVTALHNPWRDRPLKSNNKSAYRDVPPPYISNDGRRLIAAASLRDILIEQNRIFSMGRSGIGVDAFFGVETINQNQFANKLFSAGQRGKVELVSVENLFIVGNHIINCLNLPPDEIRAELTGFMGYGGIALSDVENLVVRDNFITDNGAEYLNPTCGIFILHGAGIEISRNRIVNNGRRNNTSANDKSVKNGARGGIYIRSARDAQMSVGNPFHLIQSDFDKINAIRNFNFTMLPSGVPALKLQENIVSVPMGRALTVRSVGHLSITDNQFLSQSIVPGISLENSLAASVLILSFNTSEYTRSQPATYEGVRNGNIQAKQELKFQGQQQQQVDTKEAAETNEKTVALEDNSQSNVIEMLFDRFLNGGIIFAHNQIQLISATRRSRNEYLNKAGFSIFGGVCSVMILSLDDVAFLGNQSFCNLGQTKLLTNTLLFGMNVRANDNSWQETPFSVFLSAVTLGLMNTTTNNHSLSCLLVRGGWYWDKFNLVLAEAILAQFPGEYIEKGKEGACSQLISLLGGFAQQGNIANGV